MLLQHLLTQGAGKLQATAVLTHTCCAATYTGLLMKGNLRSPAAGADCGCCCAEPIYGGNSINPIGIIFWLLQGLGILSMAFI